LVPESASESEGSDQDSDASDGHNDVAPSAHEFANEVCLSKHRPHVQSDHIPSVQVPVMVAAKTNFKAATVVSEEEDEPVSRCAL
jgi:hypothetical protein